MYTIALTEKATVKTGWFYSSFLIFQLKPINAEKCNNYPSDTDKRSAISDSVEG